MISSPYSLSFFIPELLHSYFYVSHPICFFIFASISHTRLGIELPHHSSFTLKFIELYFPHNSDQESQCLPRACCYCCINLDNFIYFTFHILHCLIDALLCLWYLKLLFSVHALRLLFHLFFSSCILFTTSHFEVITYPF